VVRREGEGHSLLQRFACHTYMHDNQAARSNAFTSLIYFTLSSTPLCVTHVHITIIIHNVPIIIHKVVTQRCATRRQLMPKSLPFSRARLRR